MEIENKTFDINITNDDPKQNAIVLAFRRYRKIALNKKSREGKDVQNVSLALYTPENAFLLRLNKDEDLLDEFISNDNEIDLELTGKIVGRTATILFTGENELCYNFTEYEIKKDRSGNIIPCPECGEVHCEHRIKHQIYSNVNEENAPITWIKKYMLDKREALKRWSFERSYQIVHTNGLTYDFLYKIASLLQDLNKVVFVAPVIDKNPQKLVIRTGNIPFYGWLEGRVRDDKYALILHGTTFKLSD